MSSHVQPMRDTRRATRVKYMHHMTDLLKFYKSTPLYKFPVVSLYA